MTWPMIEASRRFAILAVLLAAQVAAWAADPLVGTWRLERVEINGETTKSTPLQLSVYEIRDSLSFAFAAQVDGQFVTTIGYRVLLNGTEADVKNAKGDRIGTVKMTIPGPSQYAITLKRPEQPATTGKLVLSPDGKTLTSETDTPRGDQTIHMVQVFARQ